MTGVPVRFYSQVTYNEQLQAYVFTDTNALIPADTNPLIPAETSMYIMFHEPKKKEILDTFQRLGNLDKLRQKNMAGQRDTCYVKMLSSIR